VGVPVWVVVPVSVTVPLTPTVGVAVTVAVVVPVPVVEAVTVAEDDWLGLGVGLAVADPLVVAAGIAELVAVALITPVAEGEAEARAVKEAVAVGDAVRSAAGTWPRCAVIGTGRTCARLSTWAGTRARRMAARVDRMTTRVEVRRRTAVSFLTAGPTPAWGGRSWRFAFVQPR